MNSNVENKEEDKLGKIAHFSDSDSQQGPSSCSIIFFFSFQKSYDLIKSVFRLLLVKSSVMKLL